MQGSGKDGWLPGVDQSASTASQQTVSTSTTGWVDCWVVCGLDLWLDGCAMMCTNMDVKLYVSGGSQGPREVKRGGG